MTSHPIKETLRRLATLRAQVEQIEGKALSEEEFVSRYLPYSSTVWSRVNSGTYRGNLDKVQQMLEQAADDIENRLDSIQRRVEQATSFVVTRFASPVLGAHLRALDDGDGCRIVVALAPTGAGKSTIAEYLTRKHSAIFVEGSDTWLTSYKAFCLDVAEAAGKSLKSRFDQRDAEKILFDALGKKHGTLVIDEANTQSAPVANMLKKIINKTNYTIVIFAIPERWDNFAAKNSDEVKQVQNRCQAVLRFDSVPERDVDAFLSDSFTDNRKQCCKLIAIAANEFGAYKTVKRICDMVNKIDNATADDVAKAISIVKFSQDK
jgi:hypothetical protein